MKIWNLVAILAMSCLLPILAQKQDNAMDTAGSTCENELGQFCIDKNDTHKCIFPLAMADCPAGKQCCKTFPKDYDSADLPLRKAKKCTKKCPCCIASVDEKMTNLESAMNGVEGKIADVDSEMKGVEGKITDVDSAMKGVEGKIADVDSAMKGVDEKMTNLESAMNGVDGKVADMDSAMKGVDEKITNLESAMKDQHILLYYAIKGYLMAYGDSNYFFSPSGATWSDAQAKCVDMGGNLVKIDNDEEFSFLQDQVPEYTTTWIGLNDIEVEGQFTWIADGSIHQIQESWWHPSEPNSAGNEDCIAFWKGDGQALLNDWGCSNNAKSYICELPFLSI